MPVARNPLVTDEDHYNRAVDILDGDVLRYGERLDPTAVARHAAKLLKIRLDSNSETR